MPSDIFYGQDSLARIGVMADAVTDPATWHHLEYKSLVVNPDNAKGPRPLMGRALHNSIDPIRPRNDLFRLGMELVIDADSRGLPRVLRSAFGAPVTTGPVSTIYTHVWNSGAKAETYFALQIQTGASEFRVYRGLTGASLGLTGRGDQANNYDINISLRGLTRAKVGAWVGSAPAAIFDPSPAQRLIMKLGGAAATNIISAGLNWNRRLAEGAFLSQTPAISGLTPDANAEHTGQCSVRAIAGAFDTLEEANTASDIVLQFTGMAANHDIQFQHILSEFDAAPLPINGPGLVERDFSWKAYQDATNPALKITVKNDIASYA
jgi:hypothetical protein